MVLYCEWSPSQSYSEVGDEESAAIGNCNWYYKIGEGGKAVLFL